MPTFGQLRTTVIAKSGAADMFAFRQKSRAHDAYWERINDVEYRKGYKPGEYQKKGSPALCDMELLTASEFERWVGEFESLKG